MRLPLTLSMVSYRSPATLASTLLSYRSNGLLDMVEEKRIILQEPTDDQVAWASKLGFKIIISDENIGVGRAFGELLRRYSTEFFLFLEEDWLLVEQEAKTFVQLHAGISLLRPEPEGVVRYRHRRDYGEPLYSIQFKGRELQYPAHLGESVFWYDDPDLAFPNFIKKVEVEGHSFYKLSSRHSCFTNNPVLYYTDFSKNNLLPFCVDDLEKPIQPWWEQQTFSVFHGQGLFRHNRLDR